MIKVKVLSVFVNYGIFTSDIFWGCTLDMLLQQHIQSVVQMYLASLCITHYAL